MLSLKSLAIVESIEQLEQVPQGKVLINTINAHSYNTALKDEVFAEALKTVRGERLTANDETGCVKYLIPDGVSIIKACRWLKAKSQPKERIAGWDLFAFEMQRLDGRCKKGDELGFAASNRRDARRCKVMFLGSSEKVLALIRERAAVDYPNLEVVTYSPPYHLEFSDEENHAMVNAINEANPDLLWIGMTAPKQEKWAYQHWKELDIHCHVGTIGAVFDFYAGTVKRAPLWWQEHSLEWLFRLIREPKRMWRRYVLGNPLFLWNVFKEKIEDGATVSAAQGNLRSTILNAEILSLSFRELLMRLERGVLITPNVNHLVQLQHDRELYEIYCRAEWVVCDSRVLYLCSKLLRIPIKEPIPGSSFFHAYYQLHRDDDDCRIFLLGAKSGAEVAMERINRCVGRRMVVGAISPSMGFELKAEENEEICRSIRESGATVVVVGVGCPKQEKWIYTYKDSLPGVRLWMALGATIDFEAGNERRAPRLVQRLCLEWFYRFLQAPRKRFRRYFIDDPKFFWYFSKQLVGAYKDPFA